MIADKLQNLSFSAIEKQDLFEQEISVMGLDGLMREDDLNSKIKMLEARIQ